MDSSPPPTEPSPSLEQPDPPDLPQSEHPPPHPQAQSDAAQHGEPRTREYLSNERTYLSWMRTAISLLGIGVILGRIHRVQPPSAPERGTTWQLGIIFAVVGLITVFLATQHYLAIRREIADDSNTETGRWVILLSIATLLLGSGIIYYVLVYSPKL